jgi:transcriptional regulator with XRE-family HTH domain
MYCDKIHIGSVIQSIFKQSGLTVSQFARLLQIQRTRIYYIFNSKTLDIDLLCKISDALHYDFITEIYLKTREDEKQNPTVINIHFQIAVEHLSELIKAINRLKKAGIIV